MIARPLRRAASLLLPLAVMAGVASPASSAMAAGRPARGTPAHVVSRARPGAFGAAVVKSGDLAINGWGDSAGYHLEVGRAAAGYAWREIATLAPAGYDASSWTGYQCVSGDGRYAAVAIMPTLAVNEQAARDHGGFAYSVNLNSGAVHPVAAGVALQYDSPGCGIGDTAVFTVSMGASEQRTELLTAQLATGQVTSAATVSGQVTSPVPVAGHAVGVIGSDLVTIPDATATVTPSVLARVGGQPYDVRAANGGIDFLDVRSGSQTSTAGYENGGRVSILGSGALDRMQLFQGRSGHPVLAGAQDVDAGALVSGGIVNVPDTGLEYGASSSSLDGHALFGAASNAKQSAPILLAPQSGIVLNDPQAAPRAKVTTGLPAFSVPLSVVDSTPQPVIGRPEPRGDAAPRHTAATGTGKKTAASTIMAMITTTAAVKVTPAAASQSPTCAVPRLDPTKQVMQPSPEQVNWAAQMAEQGLLTTATVTAVRPASTTWDWSPTRRTPIPR